MKRVRVIVSGVVQGVGFRFFTRNLGRRLGLRGFVRNLPDGSVEAEAQGGPGQLAAFLGELRTGPPSSHVSALSTSETSPVDDEEGFEIKF